MEPSLPLPGGGRGPQIIGKASSSVCVARFSFPTSQAVIAGWELRESLLCDVGMIYSSVFRLPPLALIHRGGAFSLDREASCHQTTLQYHAVGFPRLGGSTLGWKRSLITTPGAAGSGGLARGEAFAAHAAAGTVAGGMPK